jgi:hypothetical protein
MNRLAVLALAIAGVTLAPAGVASAGSLALDSACYLSGKPIVANGAVWAPGASIAITDPRGAFSATAMADTTGAFMTTFDAPTLSALKPDVREFTATATDAADPTQTSTASFSVVQPGVAANVTGKLSTPVQWSMAGFVHGETIYGHWVYKKQEKAQVKMGSVPGDCGLVRRTVRRIPVEKPGTGVWLVQFDPSRKWHSTTTPRVSLKIQVYTKFG